MKTTTMTYGYGKWICECGYEDGNGYPCQCSKCGRENSTDGKGNPIYMFPKKVVDNRKKNTKRKISDITRSEVYERDGGKCVICGNKTSSPEFHHVLYGNEAEYTPDRNNKEKLVTLCVMCHHELHFGGRSKKYREFTKKYLGFT